MYLSRMNLIYSQYLSIHLLNNPIIIMTFKFCLFILYVVKSEKVPL